MIDNKSCCTPLHRKALYTVCGANVELTKLTRKCSNSRTNQIWHLIRAARIKWREDEASRGEVKEGTAVASADVTAKIE